MEELKEAIIESDGKTRMPVCGKLNIVINNGAIDRKQRIRCRGSRRKLEHFFILNVGENEE